MHRHLPVQAGGVQCQTGWKEGDSSRKESLPLVYDRPESPGRMDRRQRRPCLNDRYPLRYVGLEVREYVFSCFPGIIYPRDVTMFPNSMSTGYT
jgi:hypothetical protein